MICNNCDKEFEGKFCPYCGTKAQEETNDCPVCGKEMLEESRFCANCGYDFESAGAVEAGQSDNAGEVKAQVAQSVDKERKSTKAMPIIAKVYRWLIAGGMLFLGVVAMLCLTAPIGVESFLGMSSPLCSGFVALGGGDGAPTSVVNASIMLLIVSILALVYGGLQLFFAIKKPYNSVKKIHFWAIDGAICLIVLILGFVVAGAVNSEQLMDAKLGAGFAMCIVMGIVGLLCLGARIFYELKLFKWEDTGLSEEQIAKAQEKKERKPIDKAILKKIALRVGVPVLVVAVLIAIIIPSVAWANNIFRVGKVDKINIGDTQEQVVKVLGEPYVKNNYYYEYYSENYTKLVDQVEALSNNLEDVFGNMDRLNTLYEQLNNIVYKYIRVDFDSDQKVSEVFFDNDKCDTYSAEDSKKEVESYKLSSNEIIQYVENNVCYSAKYTDGSFYKGIASKGLISIFILDNIEIEWKDNYGNAFKSTVSVKTSTFSRRPHDFDPSEYGIGGDFVVPEGVTQLGSELNGASFTSLTLPSSLVSIADYAFCNCSVESIIVDGGNKVFKSDGNCLINTNNNTLIWGNGNGIIPNYISSIGSYAFYNCSSLTSIEIPSGVTSIGEYAFYNCSSLTSIGECAFIHCSSLTSIEIPSSVTSIGESAFYNCGSLTSIVIPSGVTSIGEEAFYNCERLTIYCQASSQPSGWDSSWNSSWNYDRPVVWSIKDYGITDSGIQWILSNSKNVTIVGYGGMSTQVEIPSPINGYTVTSIGDYAFEDCSSLTSVTFAEGSQLTSIGYGAFDGCSSLTSIVIPSSVTSIGKEAFYGCERLTIYCEATSKPSGWDRDWNLNYSNIPVVWGYIG